MRFKDIRQRSWERGGLSRRQLLTSAAGATGAGVVLGSGLWTPAIADGEEGETGQRCAVALPIPFINPRNGQHFFFPGRVDGSDAPTDPTGPQPNGRDPSTITNFNGFVGQVDLNFTGTARDTTTGMTHQYDFHTDTRFMKGEFIASDEQRHRGAFAFI
jgi:hypothetical protein